MKPSGVSKVRVTPTNVRNGAKAPYFVLDVNGTSKKDEVLKIANEEFKNRSSLSKFDNWDLEVEKV